LATTTTISDVQVSPTKRFIKRNYKVAIAFIILIALLTAFGILQPRLFTKPVITSTSNQGMALTFAGMAQTAVVITGGIDLSVGPMVSMSNSLASSIFGDSIIGVVGAVILILIVGSVAGLINGLIVVYGRIQPIIVTLATGSIYSGIALWMRPQPGGYVPRWYGDLLTGRIFDLIPGSLVLLALVVIFIWLPFRKSKLGLSVYAVGSNEGAAFMSGVNVNRAKLAAYALGGFLAAIAGLFLTAQTSSGDATIGAVYTLLSIAAVVLGGTSLFGGSGGIAGTIAGAFALSIISSVLFFAGVNPLSQPFFEGLVLLVAVCLGATRIFTIKNRLDIMR
jgi:ribose transport system permease protein